MDKTKIIVKSMVMLVLIFIYKFVMYFIDPIIAPNITVDMAMLQMQNVEYSTTAIQAYTYIKNYAWVGLVVIGLIVFHEEILELINLLLEKGEKKNEEN